jgi:predicted acylesterase/phospholipase RssA
MLLFRNASEERTAGAKLRIGLALSGGGFRASIFHLGVIRRLEELGIMPEVSVISSVSGGSIIAAYYACRMEDKLRSLPVGHVPTS